jgi:cytochrome c biogenesis protein CcdA
MFCFGFVFVFGIYAVLNAESRLTLHFFGSPTCGECLEIKEEILFTAQRANPDKIDLRIHDVDSDSGMNLLLIMEEKYGVKSTAAIELFFPDTFLIGADEIEKNGARLIDLYLQHPEKWTAADVNHIDNVTFVGKLKERFQGYSMLSIVAAGIIDGINPCAIATMIFLISFFATQKRKRSEILAIGLSFTFAVFVTYLLLGIGAFKALSFLTGYRWVSLAIRWSAVGLAGIVGLYSFRDAFVYRKTGKAQDIKLQLPKAVKLRIHKVISGQLSAGSLVWGAMITGFLVTLLEAVCTGQVYLPTIILMTKQEGLKFTGWLYLLLYNFLFILPLLIVMILAYFGLKWDKLAKTTQKNLPLIKVVFGIVLISLAVFLAIAG